MYISEIRTSAPTDERMPLERKMYETLDKLKIPYEQVDNDPAASMEECAAIDQAIGQRSEKMYFYVTRRRQHFSYWSCLQIRHLIRPLSAKN